MSIFNCKVVEEIPTHIYKGKDNNVLVLVSVIRGVDKIRLIDEETFKLHLVNFFYEQREMGCIERYDFITKSRIEWANT